MLPKKPKILYFINGFQHTVDELLDSRKYSGASVEYRNALLVDSVEPGIDGVAALNKTTIPPQYAKHATAAEAIEIYNEAIEELQKSSGDEVAPSVTGDTENLPEFGKEEPVKAPVAKKKS